MATEYEVTKIGAAVDQLDWAIKLFLDDQAYVPAITLAAAAEELIGATVPNATFTQLKAKLAADTGLSVAAVTQDHLNKAKNWVKHWQALKDAPTIVLELETEAIQYIVRAANNFVLYDASMTSETPRFFKWLIANRPDLMP